MTKDNSQSELPTGYIKVSLDFAPRDSDKAFREWCKKHDFDCFGLDFGREAWCSSLGTYLRGASGVAYADGESFLFYEEDLFDAEAHTNNRINEVLDRLEERQGDYYARGSGNPYSNTNAVPLSAIETERTRIKEGL